jgi:hypothetical protein
MIGVQELRAERGEVRSEIRMEDGILDVKYSKK